MENYKYLPCTETQPFCTFLLIENYFKKCNKKLGLLFLSIGFSFAFLMFFGQLLYAKP